MLIFAKYGRYIHCYGKISSCLVSVHIFMLISNRHKAEKTDFYSLGTLSEYLVCRELLWMFYTQTQMVVFQQNENAEFSIRPNISIPSLTTVCTYFNKACIYIPCT